MTSYQLIAPKDEKIARVIGWVLTISFFLPVPFLFFFVQDRSTAQILSLLLLVFSAIIFLGLMVSYNYRGKYATLEDDTLKVYTPRGREIGVYPLKKMNNLYCLVFYGGRGGCREGLLLYEKGLRLNGGYLKQKYGYLPYVNLYQHSRDEKKRMVVIQNKVLEEKILAYYAEQPIDDQE